MVKIGKIMQVGRVLLMFVTGLVLIELLAFKLGLFPANSSIRVTAGFWESVPMLILPAITATLVLLAYIYNLNNMRM